MKTAMEEEETGAIRIEQFPQLSKAWHGRRSDEAEADVTAQRRE